MVKDSIQMDFELKNEEEKNNLDYFLYSFCVRVHVVYKDPVQTLLEIDLL